jgi:prepilin-type N-terminal cleavage/methylation domain-containing protein
MHGERGFTLVEFLVAAAIISVGLLGVVIVVPVAGYNVREGKQLSQATFLAEERIEQIRRATWMLTASGDVHDCIGVSSSATVPPTTSACPAGTVVTFPDEGLGALPAPFEQYSRSVRVISCHSIGACPVRTDDARLVTVTVRYIPISGVGGNVSRTTKPVVLSGLVAKNL